MMTLNPRIVGQAEHAHEAILNRALAGTGLTKRHWVALVSGQVPQGIGDDLIGQGLLSAELTVTAAGTELVGRVLEATADVVTRAYADIPAEELATAARVLATITERLDRELALTG